MRPRGDLPAVVDKEKLGLDNVEQFLTILRNLVRKLAIVELEGMGQEGLKEKRVWA